MLLLFPSSACLSVVPCLRGKKEQRKTAMFDTIRDLGRTWSSFNLKKSFHPSKLTINTFCSSSVLVPPFASHLWPSSCSRSSRCSSFSLFCSDCYLDPLSQDPERPPLIVVSYCGIINNNTDFNSSLGSSIIANLGKIRKYWLKRPLVRSLECKVTNAD